MKKRNGSDQIRQIPLGRTHLQDPQRRGRSHPPEPGAGERRLRQTFARSADRRPNRRQTDARDLSLRSRGLRVEPPAGQERPRLLSQHHSTIGTRQAQHPPRNGLRLPRPGYGTSDQKGAARTGQPYGEDIFGRRGRLLRVHPDKTFAYIYDIIVVPDYKLYSDDSIHEMERSQVKQEIMRVAYFASLSDNYYDTINVLHDLLDYYDIELSSLISELQNQ